VVRKKNPLWLPEEKEILKNFFHNVDSKTLRKLLPERDQNGIRRMVFKLKISKLPNEDLLETLTEYMKRTGVHSARMKNVLKFMDMYEPTVKNSSAQKDFKAKTKRKKLLFAKTDIEDALAGFEEWETVGQATLRHPVSGTTLMKYKKFLESKNYGTSGKFIMLKKTKVDELMKNLKQKGGGSRNISWPSDKMVVQKCNLLGIPMAAKEIGCVPVSLRIYLKTRNLYSLVDKEKARKLRREKKNEEVKIQWPKNITLAKFVNEANGTLNAAALMKTQKHKNWNSITSWKIKKHFTQENILFDKVSKLWKVRRKSNDTRLRGE